VALSPFPPPKPRRDVVEIGEGSFGISSITGKHFPPVMMARTGGSSFFFPPKGKRKHQGQLELSFSSFQVIIDSICVRCQSLLFPLFFRDPDEIEFCSSLLFLFPPIPEQLEDERVGNLSEAIPFPLSPEAAYAGRGLSNLFYQCSPLRRRAGR